MSLHKANSNKKTKKCISFSPSSPIMERCSTGQVKQAFEDIEKDDFNKTITKYLNTQCWCGNSIKNKEDIAITSCGHSCHSKCMYEYLEHNQDNLNICCFTCRTALQYISTIECGHNSIVEFIDKYNIKKNIFGDGNDDECDYLHDTPPMTQVPKLKRMHTNSASAYILDERNDDRSSKHMVILKEIPIQNSFKNINGISTELSVMYTDLINFDENILGTVVLTTPYSELSNNPDIDIYVILDVSGSIYPILDLFKQSLKEIVLKLKENQRFTIITFDDYAVHLIPLGIINTFNINNILTIIDNIQCEGGTNYNVAFELLSKIISNRQSLIFFLTDGDPSNETDLEIIRKIYDEHPTIMINIISMGGFVDASTKLIPLLFDRHHELAKYRHFADFTDFPSYIEEIVGEACAIYATKIRIVFKNITPISSQINIIDATTSYIDIPSINCNSTTLFSFTKEPSNMEPFSISVSYFIDENQFEKIALLDNTNVLGNVIKINYPIKRINDCKINEIIRRKDITSKSKIELCQQILDSSTEDMYGIFYEEFTTGLKSLIKSMTDVTSRNKNAQNVFTQTTQNSPGIPRIYSSTLSHTLSTPHNDVMDDVIEDLPNEESELEA
jgi:uncharacterized protein YegL